MRKELEGVNKEEERTLGDKDKERRNLVSEKVKTGKTLKSKKRRRRG